MRICKNPSCKNEVIGRSQKIFCSRKCSSEYHNSLRKTNIELNCLFCGESFTGRTNQTYCSYECRYKYNNSSRVKNIESICGYCGKKFRPTKYQKSIIARKMTVYCCKLCRHEAAKIRNRERNRGKYEKYQKLYYKKNKDRILRNARKYDGKKKSKSNGRCEVEGCYRLKKRGNRFLCHFHFTNTDYHYEDDEYRAYI